MVFASDVVNSPELLVDVLGERLVDFVERQRLDGVEDKVAHQVDGALDDIAETTQVVEHHVDVAEADVGCHVVQLATEGAQSVWDQWTSRFAGSSKGL